MATMTVLSGPERRRRWSAEEKARIAEETLQPGAVVTAIARRHDVHPNLLHHWRRQARRAAAGQARFVPVRVVTTSKGVEAGGTMVIKVGGDVQVHVDAGVDEAALGRVLRALGR